MRRISILLLGISVAALFLNAIISRRVFAQKLSAVPVDLEIPIAPTPVKANGKIHLLYELHITNFRARNLELTRIEVLKDAADISPLASYKDVELTNRLGRPGAPADLADKRLIGSGLRAVVFLQIIVDTENAVPRTLHHRLFFKPNDPNVNTEERVVEGARVVVYQNTPLVIGSPLRGEGWLAANGLSNKSDHRRALIPVNGKARVAQRFAADWIKFGTDGQVAREDPSKNANWYGYGAEVLAVADAVVVDVKDGIPENVPLTEKRAVPITLETIGGNYVILDLGNGYFAFYAHLQPKSISVKVGDKVRRGSVLGLLGNSGNSDAPHLHFHIADANSPLGAEGVPFVFESFDLQGVIKSLEALASGEGWKPQPNAPVDKRRMEMPLENAVVRFP